MAFNGNFEHSLDAKNRLSIPSRFRDSFPAGIVLSQDTDPCVSMSTLEAHDARVQGALAGRNPLSSQYKQIQRFFRGNSWEAELDSAGRITLPSQLREHAGIDREVIVAGVDDHLELWSPEGWQAHQAMLGDVMEGVIDALGDPS